MVEQDGETGSFFLHLGICSFLYHIFVVCGCLSFLTVILGQRMEMLGSPTPTSCYPDIMPSRYHPSIHSRSKSTPATPSFGYRWRLQVLVLLVVWLRRPCIVAICYPDPPCSIPIHSLLERGRMTTHFGKPAEELWIKPAAGGFDQKTKKTRP